ncbi:MAG TPA: 23S rRNA (pseudouridine(1915)-N(3))-methyltransferase RlmH [Clostridiales bacterium]|nr:23S rRNA (pseudouridine(1915)-N(3))-methyltransferase RlmH [Clostridiales bacterium]
MLSIRLICVGKMREKHYIEAFSEYSKRLSAYCKFETEELPEFRLGENPSGRELEAALSREAQEVEKRIPAGAYIVALCIEGRQLSSAELAGLFEDCAVRGKSRLCFIIGGSFGLHDSIKNRANLKLSMSKMTFPHHLARVMLAEQIYRGFSIMEGSKYHK